MGTRTQHTKTDLSRVLRGRCWLRNTRYSQLALGAAARLLCSRVCESGSVATARPCQRTGPSSSLRPNIFLLSSARFRELFLLLWCASNGLCLALWPRACAACSSCRSGDAPPRYEQGAERRFPRSPKAEKPRILAEDRFFFLLILRE